MKSSCLPAGILLVVVTLACGVFTRLAASPEPTLAPAATATATTAPPATPRAVPTQAESPTAAPSLTPPQ